MSLRKFRRVSLLDKHEKELDRVEKGENKFKKIIKKVAAKVSKKK